MAGGSTAFVVGLLTAILLVALEPGVSSWLFWTVSVGVALVVLLRAVLRIRVEIDRHEITVINLWRTHRLSWASVREIDVAGMVWPSTAAFYFALWSPVRIRTQDGRSVYIQASLDNRDRVTSLLRAWSSDSAVT
jgi:hypothetical protein